MQDRATVLARYSGALDKLVVKLEEDYYVLAAVLYGSLARGEPWEKSDIDLFIVVRDGRESRARPYIWLTEDGIDIFAEVFPRSRFRQALEGALQGSILHSIRSQCRLLFGKDPSIETWLTESSHVGERDQDYQLLHTFAGIPYLLDKVEKWLYAKHDVPYSFLWLMHVVNELAWVEVVLHAEAPGREALDQALAYNPDFFTAVYLDVVGGPKTEEAIVGALQRIDGYLLARADRIFGPILSFLAEAEDPRTCTELDAHFRKKVQGQSLAGVCDWLAEHGSIERLTSPVRLTRKSLVELDEPAYYYDTDDVSNWE
jgi:hypothetical protein